MVRPTRLGVSMLLAGSRLAARGPSPSEPTVVHAVIGDRDDPEATVRRFCDIDGEGARLGSATWDRIAPFLVRDNEPGSDCAVVVRSYRVDVVAIRDQEARVRVRYDVAGVTCGDTWYPADTREAGIVRLMDDETEVVFELTHVFGGW